MGFTRDKTYALTWAPGTEFAGLQVEAKVLPIGFMEQFGELIDLRDRAGDDFTKADMDRIVGLFRDFGDEALVSWNFEVKVPDPAHPDDPSHTVTVPVPPTGDGMAKVDLEMGLAIIEEWFTAVTGVSDDLGKDSPPGATSPAVPIPMEPLSASLPSSMTPS